MGLEITSLNTTQAVVGEGPYGTRVERLSTPAEI